MKFEFGGGADIQVKLRGDLRRHALGDGAGGVVAGREQVEGEAAFGVGGGGVTRSGGRVHGDDRSLGDAAAAGVDDGAVNCAGGGVLGWGAME